MIPHTPDFILFAQHGWADTSHAIAELANSLATPETAVITPNLGFLRTWLRIEPLICQVEDAAAESFNQYPDVPVRVVGHSMGGLIWLEVLNRRSDWWPRIESLVLVASPVGGSDLGRIIDPLNLGVGIARDLGRNRREIAETVASQIPTLIIAGNNDGGSDGTVPIGCTKFRNAQFLELPHISHAAMKNHPAVAAAIQEFWQQPFKTMAVEKNENPHLRLDDELIRQLQNIEGMTDGHPRDFPKANIRFTFENGLTIRTWKNIFGIDHVFLVDNLGRCIYSGFIGWKHADGLRQRLQAIRSQFAPSSFHGEGKVKDTDF